MLLRPVDAQFDRLGSGGEDFCDLFLRAPLQQAEDERTPQLFGQSRDRLSQLIEFLGKGGLFGSGIEAAVGDVESRLTVG